MTELYYFITFIENKRNKDCQSDMRPFNLINRESHVFVINYAKVLDMRDFYPFLEEGIANNELVIVFLRDCSKYKICNEVRRPLNLKSVEYHQKKGDILIKGTGEWFNPSECLNAEIFIRKWESLIARAIKTGKEGIRIFVETNKFMRERLDNALITYDKILQDLFDFPITSMYIYNKDDINSMTPQQIAILNSNSEFHIKGIGNEIDISNKRF